MMTVRDLIHLLESADAGITTSYVIALPASVKNKSLPKNASSLPTVNGGEVTIIIQEDN